MCVWVNTRYDGARGILPAIKRKDRGTPSVLLLIMSLRVLCAKGSSIATLYPRVAVVISCRSVPMVVALCCLSETVHSCWRLALRCPNCRRYLFVYFV